MTRSTGSADLAGQVLALAQDLAHVQAEVQQLAAEQRDLPDLVQHLADLSTRLDTLAEDDKTTREPLWDWTRMNREQAQHAWTTLAGWVEDILGGIYDLVGITDATSRPAIPACWYQHSDLLIELSWLCQEWRKIYTTPTGVPTRAGDWHERHLPGVLARSQRGTARTCVRGKHNDYTHRTPPMTLHQVMEADLARRA